MPLIAALSIAALASTPPPPPPIVIPAPVDKSPLPLLESADGWPALISWNITDARCNDGALDTAGVKAVLRAMSNRPIRSAAQIIYRFDIDADGRPISIESDGSPGALGQDLPATKRLVLCPLRHRRQGASRQPEDICDVRQSGAGCGGARRRGTIALHRRRSHAMPLPLLAGARDGITAADSRCRRIQAAGRDLRRRSRVGPQAGPDLPRRLSPARGRRLGGADV